MAAIRSVNFTFGAVFDGAAISAALYGIASAQALKYNRSFSNDRPLLRVLVCAVWLLDTVQTLFVTHMLWYYLINRGADNPAFFLYANWSLICQVIPTEASVVLVESFFIRRMWILSERNKLTLLPVIPMLIGWGHSFGYVAKCFEFPAFSDSSEPKYMLTMCAGCRAFTDIVIAATMCYMLYQRQLLLSTEPNPLMRALLTYTLTTGLLTSIFTTVYLIVYLAEPLSLIWIGAYFLYGKIYIISMLANLNGRKSLRTLANRDIDLDSFVVPD